MYFKMRKTKNLEYLRDLQAMELWTAANHHLVSPAL